MGEGRVGGRFEIPLVGMIEWKVTHKEVEMDMKKIFWVELLALVLTLSFIGPAFSQSGPNRVIAHAGAIEWVSNDFKLIYINERKVLISPQTKILDDQGNSLKVTELRRGRRVVVELVRISDGSMEKRVIIKK
jgi:hypothetical protein